MHETPRVIQYIEQTKLFMVSRAFFLLLTYNNNIEMVYFCLVAKGGEVNGVSK